MLLIICMVSTFWMSGWVSELGACGFRFFSFARVVMEKWDWAWDGVCMMDRNLLLWACASFFDLLHDVMTDMMNSSCLHEILSASGMIDSITRIEHGMSQSFLSTSVNGMQLDPSQDYSDVEYG